MKKLITYFLALLTLPAFAGNTKYYGGYISAYRLGNSNTYQIKVNLYTQKDSLPPDTIKVQMGAELVQAGKTDSMILPNNTALSIYAFNYSFLTGSQTISYTDTTVQNFERNINSNAPFYIDAQFSISPFVGISKLLDFYDIPIVKVQKNQPLDYNPVALTDTVSDSLNFKLLPTDTANDYWLPTGITINKHSGEIKWNNPDTLGNYTLLILAKQYRNGIQISKQLKRVTIDVENTSIAPTFSNIQNWSTNGNGYYEYHIHPNQNLQLFFSYQDYLCDSVSIVGYSEVFQSPNTGTYSVLNNNANQKTALFNWTPNTSDIRTYPYLVNLICESKKDTNTYFTYKTVMIYVEPSTTGIANNTLVHNNINVYPNPSNGSFGIETKVNNAMLSVYNDLGKLIYVKQMQGNKTSINLSNQPAGIYLLKVKTKKDTLSRKLVLEK